MVVEVVVEVTRNFINHLFIYHIFPLMECRLRPCQRFHNIVCIICKSSKLYGLHYYYYYYLYNNDKIQSLRPCQRFHLVPAYIPYYDSNAACVLRSISEISSCFLDRDPGTLKSDIVSKKTSTINLFGFETLIESSKIGIMETDPCQRFHLVPAYISTSVSVCLSGSIMSYNNTYVCIYIYIHT